MPKRDTGKVNFNHVLREITEFQPAFTLWECEVHAMTGTKDRGVYVSVWLAEMVANQIKQVRTTKPSIIDALNDIGLRL